MALIKCEECGHMISDKAAKCPKCGAPIEKKITCEECGQLVSDKASECPNCGAPMVRKSDVSVAEENANKVKETKKAKPKRLKYIIGVGILVVLAIIGYFIFTQVLKDELNGHEYVDLGLSVKWATCNVGASTPEESGDYFAWGEIEPKETYTDVNCTTYKIEMEDIAGNPNYDAALANWGDAWRMPTKDEMQELLDKCIWIRTIQEGHEGYKIIGPNGNSIFLPAAGNRDETSLSGVGEDGIYWSSTPEGPQCAYYLFFESGDRYYTSWGIGRPRGLNVRAVTESNAMSKKQPQSSNAETNALQPTTISSNDLSTANGTVNGYGYVDMGLSVKWATCNVGASSPEDYGNYYVWGETRTKSTYTHNNYTPVIEFDIAGNPRYDAARANWGGTWRMPTQMEIQELIDNWDTKWVTLNGVNGRLVTSKKNGNSIFLPAAGYRDGSSLNYAGEDGYYWSSMHYETDGEGAYTLEFGNIRFGWGGEEYFGRGQSVRPVCD